jgi:hypothetical protein
MLNELERIELDVIDSARARVRGTHGSRDRPPGNSTIVAIFVCASIRTMWLTKLPKRGALVPVHDNLEEHFK